MTDVDGRLADSLAALVPSSSWDWGNVVERSHALARARRRRRHVVLVVALALLLLSAGTTLAIGNRFLGWFTVSTSNVEAPSLPAAAPYIAGRTFYRSGQQPQTLAHPLIASLLGQDAVLAVLSPGGRYLAYHSWRNSTPLLYIHDTATGQDRVLAIGAQTLAWRRDGTIAYFQADHARYQQRNGAYAGRVVVVRRVGGVPAVWTPSSGAYQVLAWARDELLVAVRPCYFPNCARDPEPGVYALNRPGHLRPLHLGTLAAVSRDGRYAFGRFDPVPGQDSPSPLVRVVRVRTGHPVDTLNLEQALKSASLRGRLPGSLLGASWRGREIVAAVAGRDSALVFLRFRDRQLTLESVIRIPARTLPTRWGTSFGVPTFVASSTGKVVVPIRGTTSDDHYLVAVLACSRPTRTCVRGTILPTRKWFAVVSNPSRPAAAGRGSP